MLQVVLKNIILSFAVVSILIIGFSLLFLQDDYVNNVNIKGHGVKALKKG
jgi:hypothetical protein